MIIGVFFGGSSSEKEVSLEGGRNVVQKLSQTEYEPLPIFVDAQYRLWQLPEKLLVQNTTADIAARVDKDAERVPYEDLMRRIDFAFVVGHGKYMEDGALAGLLEMLNIPYNGPGILGLALSADKAYQRRILQSHGIDVPLSLEVGDQEWHKDKQAVLRRIEQTIPYPIITKPTREGCSTAIAKCTATDMLEKGIEDALFYDTTILAEEFIDGRELTISVLGNGDKREVLPITETPKFIGKDYLTLEDKFLPGGSEMITPAILPKDIDRQAKSIAIKVCVLLELIGYPRIDIIYDEKNGRIVVLEPNALPGITPSTMVFHQAAEIGLSPGAFLSRIIELGQQAHKTKKGTL